MLQYPKTKKNAYFFFDKTFYTNIELAQKRPGSQLLVSVPEGELSNCRP